MYSMMKNAIGIDTFDTTIHLHEFLKKYNYIYLAISLMFKKLVNVSNQNFTPFFILFVRKSTELRLYSIDANKCDFCCENAPHITG